MTESPCIKLQRKFNNAKFAEEKTLPFLDPSLIVYLIIIKLKKKSATNLLKIICSVNFHFDIVHTSLYLGSGAPWALECIAFNFT